MSIATLERVIKNFSFESTDKGIKDFKSLRGKNIVLYFYPRDNTPGCTTESNDFKMYHDEFLALDTIVLGVSRDNMKSHQKFCDKFSFTFPLISDEDEKLCTYFDVMKTKNMYGKQVRGIERSTFFIDKQGKLQKEWRKVKVDGHVETVLDFVQQQ
jgi:peroxiredoxin Q/BCP